MLSLETSKVVVGLGQRDESLLRVGPFARALCISVRMPQVDEAAIIQPGSLPVCTMVQFQERVVVREIPVTEVL